MTMTENKENTPRQAREWSAWITGTHTGVLDNRPGQYPGRRPDLEVIRVREVLAGGLQAPAPVAPVELAAPVEAAAPELEVVPELEPAEAEPPTTLADVASACEEAVEAALTDLARELGCFHNTDIPTNAGLFVPGQPRAQANARAAILALFDHVRQGGLMMRPLSAEQMKALGLQKIPGAAALAPAPAPAPKPAATEQPQAEPAAEQIVLF